MTVVERNQIDAFEQPDHLPHAERDFFVAQRLLEIAAAPEPHFVYVNKWGAHFPFAGNYPRESAIFVPDMDEGEAIGASRERLVNSYKNSMRYNVDGFFRELLQRRPPRRRHHLHLRPRPQSVGPRQCADALQFDRPP